MRHRQSGVFLISAAIAVAIFGMLVTFWGVNYAAQMRTARAERIGDALKVIGNAADTFLVKYHNDIETVLTDPSKTFEVNGLVFGYAQPTGMSDVPHLGNLSAENLIRALGLPGVGSRPAAGVGEYAIRIYRRCETPPNVGQQVCRLNTLTYLTEPLKKTYSSAPDLHLAGIAARRIGVFGGLSIEAKSFRFVDEKQSPFVVTNPAEKVGLIAMRGGAQTDAMSVNLRRDGSLRMTGDLNLEGRAADGNLKKFRIVGVKSVEADEIQTSQINLNKNGGAISGKLTLDSDLNLKAEGKPEASIVGAKDITGTGTINMKSLVAKHATVENLNATAGAMIAGALQVLEGASPAPGASTTTVTSDSVTAKSLKSASGVVELLEESKEGGRCNTWGIARDADGRVLSCQNVKGAMTWKLSSAKSKGDVSREVVREIRDEVLASERWTMTEYRLDGYSRASESVGHKIWFDLNGASKVVFCALDAEGKPVVDDVTLTYARGRYTVSGLTRRRLVCFAKGNNASSLELSYNTNPYGRMRLSPTRVSTSTAEIHARLERLATPPEAEASVTVQTMFGNGTGFNGPDMRLRMEGATSCYADPKQSRVGGNGSYFRGFPTFEPDSDGTPLLEFSSMDKVWVVCRFRNEQAARAAGFPI